MMVLIDALYINNGGGKVLLDYLISKLEEQNLVCFYLLDNRINEEEYQIKKTNKIIYIKASLFERFLFYKENKNLFSSVLCLGNIPPNIRLKAKIITYFHSQLYIKTSNQNSITEKFKYVLKRLVLITFAKNTDFWFVQTSLVKESLKYSFRIEDSKIKLMPFFPKFKSNILIERKKFTYLYVSNATVHKNHSRLIDGFCLFYDKYKTGKLVLTVDNSYKEVLELIKAKCNKYPIENIGFVNRDQLQKAYLSSQYLIFPSLAESFGLGIVEAIESGCKVIAADLPYSYSICKPSIVFNPNLIFSIFEAFEKSLDPDIAESEGYVKDKIHDIIKFLK